MTTHLRGRHAPGSGCRALFPRPLVIGSYALLLLLAACSPNTAAPPVPTTAPAPPAPAAPATQAAQPPNDMHFDSTTMDIKGQKFAIEIAQSDDQIARGLMFRDSMPADHGMLFVLPYADTWSFWMKNTRIPLDIVYLDPTGHVVAIHHRKPFDETGMAPDRRALYVIELNAGRAEAIGLKFGDSVALPEKYLKPASPNSEKTN